MESFDSKSEALQYIESGIESGQYQDCGHLTVADTLDFHGRKHHPCCNAHSLGTTGGYRAVASTSCPKGCHFFITKEEFQREQKKLERRRWLAQARKRVVHTVKTVVTAPFVYFQKLPALVQLLLIVLLIIWLLPQFKNTIIDILKALKSG